MSEEEIINVLSYQLNMKNTDVYTPINYDAIQGLLDLYNKQKEEIKHQKQQRKYWRENFYKQQKEIREKIKEIESYAFTSEEEKNQQDYAIERIKELL